MVLDGQGRPLCCELWPGNVTDVKTLIPVVDRLRKRFRISTICVVADRGMISKETIAQLQDKQRGVRFILGARLRNVKEIYETVLARGGRYREVHPPRKKSSDPSPLKVNEVLVDQRRYVVCLNEEVALKYKQLWMVEEMFRTAKTLLETRPIFHHVDDTIRSHVFCSFLALVLRKELQDRLEAAGEQFEWAEILRDMKALENVEVKHNEKHFLLRSELEGSCSAVFRSVGVAIPPTIQQL